MTNVAWAFFGIVAGALIVGVAGIAAFVYWTRDFWNF